MGGVYLSVRLTGSSAAAQEPIVLAAGRVLVGGRDRTTGTGNDSSLLRVNGNGL